MLAHLRANLLLVVLSFAICCGLYPLALLAVGQGLFPNKANGSMVYGKDGKLLGSRLIARDFKGDEYFTARPSAVSYDAAAAGGSNWGANNYLLRDRVARTIAPVAKYASGPNKGKDVAPDVVKWFREEKPGVAADWAKAHNSLAQNWAKSEDATKDYVKDWFKNHPTELQDWKNANPDKSDPAPENLAVAFFESFAKENPGTWLAINEKKDEKGSVVKVVELIKKTSEDPGDIAAVFFDTWVQDHPKVEMDAVPGDMVMASGSGLDPHVTLKNAQFQLDRVAGKWAELTKGDAAKIRGEIDQVLRVHTTAPMWGLAGVDMVNVMDVNLALRAKYAK